MGGLPARLLLAVVMLCRPVGQLARDADQHFPGVVSGDGVDPLGGPQALEDVDLSRRQHHGFVRHQSALSCLLRRYRSMIWPKRNSGWRSHSGPTVSSAVRIFSRCRVSAVTWLRRISISFLTSARLSQSVRLTSRSSVSRA